MVRRVNNMFERDSILKWNKKFCLNCNQPFRTVRKNKNCCSSKCHKELVEKQKKRKKK